MWSVYGRYVMGISVVQGLVQWGIVAGVDRGEDNDTMDNLDKKR